MKIILDTDVLIGHFRRRTEAILLSRLADRTQWHMSSVVAMELRAGCLSRSDVRSLESFLRPFERTGRTVHPNHAMWVRAGSILADLGSRHAIERTKRRTIANDTLIALSALSIGAAVVTLNARDFSLLAGALPFTWFGDVDEALTAIG